MQLNYPRITYLYHFFSEAIIVFLLMLPIMHYVYEWVPYWRYVGLVIVACCLLFIKMNHTKNSVRLLLVIPLLIGVFYVSGFPLLLSVLFPLLLIWRYINIMRALILNRENGYLKITLLLATLFILFIQDPQVIYYTFGLFLLLIFGYVGGQLAIMDKQQRRQVDYKLFIIVFGTISLGALITYLSFDVLRWVTGKLWGAYSFFMVILGDLGIRFMEKVDWVYPEIADPNEFEIEGNLEQHVQDTSHNKLLLTGNVLTYVYIAIAVVIVALIIMYVIRLYKTKIQTDNVTHSKVVSYESLNNYDHNRRSIFKRMFNRYFNKPNDIVRKMVYDFEHKARKKGQGRYPFETIEDWLTRLQINDNLSIYQKVRYGEIEANDTEIEMLKEQLKKIESDLKRQQH